MKINEGLAFEDLKGLIDNSISIDQFKPKIGDDEDTVVVAFTVKYELPAKDLSNFIETGDLDHIDVDVSTVPDEYGSYKVFVEFIRDYDLFEKINALLTSVDQIIKRDDNKWEYIAYGMTNEKPFNEDNFDADIIVSKVEYRRTIIKGTDELEEHFKQRLNDLRRK